jgi:hypothetical protein
MGFPPEIVLSRNCALSLGMIHAVPIVPNPYASKRVTLDFREIAYGVGGVELYDLGELDAAQLGYSVHPNGRSLVGSSPGEWQQDWIVIGHETACGDPIFLSTKPPHPVFTAMHGQGKWEPKMISPTMESFWECLQAFKQFAIGRGNPVDLQRNPPDEAETEAYLKEVFRFCDDDANAVVFWYVQAEIGMNDNNHSSGPRDR